MCVMFLVFYNHGVRLDTYSFAEGGENDEERMDGEEERERKNLK